MKLHMRRGRAVRGDCPEKLDAYGAIYAASRPDENLTHMELHASLLDEKMTHMELHAPRRSLMKN